jgi:hypothetical protein
MEKRGIRRYRVYFNRRGAPEAQAWTIDTGSDTERRHFREVTIMVSAVSSYNGKDPDWKNPIAWFEVFGRLNVRGDRATITRGVSQR